MPFPLVAMVPALIAWGTRALAAYGLARVFTEEPVRELRDIITGWVVQVAAEKAGLSLDHVDPFSDASFAAAVGDRIGVPLRSLKDKDMVLEDVDGFIAKRLSAKLGYQIGSILDQEALRGDVQNIGAALVSERVGLPLGVIAGDAGFDAAAVRERVLQWAQAELMTRAAVGVGPMVAQVMAAGNIEEVAATLNARLAEVESGQVVDALTIANRVSLQLAADASARFAKSAQQMSKRSRKQELNRAAQAKFRARHGNRQEYKPLGM